MIGLSMRFRGSAYHDAYQSSAGVIADILT